MKLSEDQIRFIAANLATIPMSLALRYITNISVRKWFSLILGSLVQFYVYGLELWIPWTMHLVIYMLILFKGRKCGVFITVFSLVTLSVYHIYRLMIDYGSWNLDVSTTLMMLVCKYSMLAFSYQDGGVGRQSLKFESQKSNRLEKLPSFLDYIIYLQFLPTCVTNTAFQYKDFSQYINIEGDFKSIPFKGSVLKAAEDLAISVVSLAIYAFGLLYFPIQTMKEDAFPTSGPLFICYYSFFSIFLVKFRYYFGWKLAQLSVHASGVSYLPVKDKPQDDLANFNRIQTCNPWTVESTLHLREKVSNWNMSTQLWLRCCIYERLPPMSRGLAQICVFVTSAFWHGYYGGYYLSFVFWFLTLHLAGLIFNCSKNKSNPLIKLYDSTGKFGYAIIWIVWTWMFSHLGLYFHVLSAHQGFLILKSLHFMPIPLLILAIIVFTVMPSGGKKTHGKSKTEKDQVKGKDAKQQ